MGGALVLHKIRNTTSDIDIGCTNVLFEQLESSGYRVCISKSGRKRIDYNDIVHIYKGWTVKSITYINGFSVASLSSIIEDKQRLGRPKDITDIALIQQIIEKDK